MWTPKRVALLVVGAVSVVALSWVLGRDAEPSAPSASPLSSPAGTVTDGPAASPDEAPVAARDEVEAAVPQVAEFDRSADGARDAAIAYLESTEMAVSVTPTEAASWARAMASSSFADEFATDTETQMVELRDTIPTGITLRLAPIETRVTPDRDGWRVSVWFVEAITIGTDGVVDDWRTATYRMVWEDDTWKIDAFASERGPMPGRGSQPASETPAGFEALLEGFDDQGLS